MAWLDDVVGRARDVVAAVESLDLWPPWEAARPLVEALTRACAVATDPPAPAPEDLRASAAAWRRTAASVESACADLDSAHDRVDQEAWNGESGDAFRGSLARLTTRTRALPPAAREVATALETAADAVAAARGRHAVALDELRASLDLSLRHRRPTVLAEEVRGVADGAGHALREAIGAYDDARDAVAAARERVLAAMADVDLSRQVRAEDLDGYRQPDPTTCGSATLVMSRMIHDAAYARWVETGRDPQTGRVDDQTAHERFAAEALAMHRRTNRPVTTEGDLQVPWPQALGTAPWALAHQLSATDGGGVPGTTYQVDTVSPRDRGRAFDRVRGSVAAGHTVPLYVGNALRPAHVVLVTSADDDRVTLYDPAIGRRRTVSRQDFTDGDLGVSGWDEPWFTVTPPW